MVTVVFDSMGEAVRLALVADEYVGGGLAVLLLDATDPRSEGYMAEWGVLTASVPAAAARSRWGPRRRARPSSSASSPPRGPRPTRWQPPADGRPSGSVSGMPRPSTARRAERFTSRGEMGGGRGRGPDGPRFSFPGDAELPPSKCLGRWELDATIYCACNGDTRLLFG